MKTQNKWIAKRQIFRLHLTSEYNIHRRQNSNWNGSELGSVHINRKILTSSSSKGNIRYRFDYQLYDLGRLMRRASGNRASCSAGSTQYLRLARSGVVGGRRCPCSVYSGPRQHITTLHYQHFAADCGSFHANQVFSDSANVYTTCSYFQTPRQGLNLHVQNIKYLVS